MYNKVRLLASGLFVVALGVVGCKSKECAECNSGSQYGYSPPASSPTRLRATQPHQHSSQPTALWVRRAQ